MLSKTEREYLSGTYSPSYAHKRVLDHKIKKKIKEFFQLELPLIQNAIVSDFVNTVSKFTYNINTNLIAEGTRSPICEANAKVRKGVEPLCISFAGSRITVLPPHHFKKYEMNN